jgi:hypothetical protein
LANAGLEGGWLLVRAIPDVAVVCEKVPACDMHRSCSRILEILSVRSTTTLGRRQRTAVSRDQSTKHRLSGVWTRSDERIIRSNFRVVKSHSSELHAALVDGSHQAMSRQFPVSIWQETKSNWRSGHKEERSRRSVKNSKPRSSPELTVGRVLVRDWQVMIGTRARRRWKRCGATAESLSLEAMLVGPS